jgi:hypothetical protein
MGGKQWLDRLTELFDADRARARRARDSIRQVLRELRAHQRALLAEREQVGDDAELASIDSKIAVIQEQRRKGVMQLRASGRRATS